MISPERRSSTPTPPPDGSAHISDLFHSQYVNGVPGHYEERMYPGPITCLGCLCTAFFVGPFGLLAFCCPCDKKTEFCPHGSMVGAPGGMVAAPPGATVTYYQQPQPVAQYQQPPQQQPGYYPKT
jgi:hypothetical protein